MLTVGIDLGTTNSAVAYVNEHGQPEVIPNDSGKPITPSVICFKDGVAVIGEEAKELQELGLYPVAAFFKRQIGDNLFIFHADDKDYSAIELSAMLLGKLIKDAENHLGESIENAVITVPAYFRDPERKATINAGNLAGINVLQVINEPTAAAIAYGLKDINKKSHILVYDLGGGTFDVTLLKYEQALIRVLNSDGDHRLGGKDWDDRIIEYLASQFQDEYGSDPLEDTESLAELLVKAEQAKKKLTSFNKTLIAISYDDHKGRYELNRQVFAEITADLMERTMSMTTQVIEDIHLTLSDINGVLLVGGSTRMPMVHDFIKQTLGLTPMIGVNVDEAVTLGAAIVAHEKKNQTSQQKVFALAGRVKTIDITNHSLGMIAINQDRSAYINSIILPKNATIPCHDTRPYQHRTRRNTDNQLEIYMTQCETEDPADAVYLGCYMIDKIPHGEKGMVIIDVGYHYDESGTVQVDAKERTSQQVLNVKIKALPDDIPARFMGTPEAQSTEHVDCYLVFDLSGSMSGRPIKEAKKAGLAFLNQTDLSHCSIGIIGVSDSVKTKLKASQNAKKIKKIIDRLKVGETGITNDAHPFDELITLFSTSEGRHIGIILADGAWHCQKKAIKVAKSCHKQDIEIIAVGFGSADREFLNAIASSPEDALFTTMHELSDTFSSIAQVLTENSGAITLPDDNQLLKNKPVKKRSISLFSKLKRS